jgi:hypothetical protein
LRREHEQGAADETAQHEQVKAAPAAVVVPPPRGAPPPLPTPIATFTI